MAMTKVQRAVLKTIRVGRPYIGRFYEVQASQDEQCYKAKYTRSNSFILVWFYPREVFGTQFRELNGEKTWYSYQIGSVTFRNVSAKGGQP